jgi:hypothetical protein
MTPRVVWGTAGVIALIAAVDACERSAFAKPSDEERAAAAAWLECFECDESALDSLVALPSDPSRNIGREPLVRVLGDALRGPPRDVSRRLVLQAHSAYGEVVFHQGRAPNQTELDRVVDRHLTNATSRYQRQAARALGRFARQGSDTAEGYLKQALKWAHKYPDYVVDAIRAASTYSLVAPPSP